MADEIKLPAIDVKAVRETLAGYAIAAEYVERERVERLRRMSAQESWSIFIGLVEAGRSLLGDRSTLGVFEPERIANLLFVRKTLDKLASSQRTA